LKQDGLFYLGVYGGKDNETVFINSSVSDTPRFFTFYSEKYLKTVLKDYFQIVDFKTIPVGTNRFHSVLLRKI